MSNVKNIADILPEGLDESTIQSIFEMVDSTINEQVSDKISLLESKVNAYLRTKVDQLKDQALAELSEESEVFRNARLFESVRTLMALELNSGDEEAALSEMTNQHGELQEEFDVLTDQVNQLVRENERLQSTVKVLDSKVSVTESTDKEINEERTSYSNEFLNDEVMKFMPFSSQS